MTLIDEIARQLDHEAQRAEEARLDAMNKGRRLHRRAYDEAYGRREAYTWAAGYVRRRAAEEATDRAKAEALFPESVSRTEYPTEECSVLVRGGGRVVRKFRPETMEYRIELHYSDGQVATMDLPADKAEALFPKVIEDPKLVVKLHPTDPQRDRVEINGRLLPRVRKVRVTDDPLPPAREPRVVDITIVSPTMGTVDDHG